MSSGEEQFGNAEGRGQRLAALGETHILVLNRTSNASRCFFDFITKANVFIELFA